MIWIQIDTMLNIDIDNTNAINMNIKIGKISDSFEELERLCRYESDRLVTEFSNQGMENIEVVFWTDGMPELICVAKFSKGKDNKLVYELDFSQTTL